jgi:hypothetical protein
MRDFVKYIFDFARKTSDIWVITQVTKVYRLVPISPARRNPVIGDDEQSSYTKNVSNKSLFVFEIKIIENLVKICCTLMS